MKNRQELAKYFNELGFKIGAEVGVCRGLYSKTLCDSIPGLTLYGIDSWSDEVGTHKGRNARSYQDTLNNLDSYIKSGHYKIIRKTSMQALPYIPHKSLDFVFLDAGHDYQSVKDDVKGWTRKVRSGGIISGHDYYVSKLGQVEVIPAVNEYVKLHNLQLNVIDWDKENPDKDSRQPCWWFVKP